MKYLDPKNDLTFRKIFGQRPHLLLSFLNSVLPLQEGQRIESLQYLEPELIPELPQLKRSMVDVHCTDNHHRTFIVEMQMYWTSAFKQRMLFNTGKAYVRQLKGAGKYRDLKPVYGLSLVDDIFHRSPELQDTYYHHYRLVHSEVSNEQIEGLELIFVELPKFKAKNFTDKRLKTLWLRFLTEIDENTESVPDALTDISEIKEALECVSKSAFSEEELLHYDSYWDAIRVEKAALEELEEKNILLNKEKNEAVLKAQEAALKAQKAESKAIEEQKQREMAENTIKSAVKQMHTKGLSLQELSQVFNLPVETIQKMIEE